MLITATFSKWAVTQSASARLALPFALVLLSRCAGSIASVQSVVGHVMARVYEILLLFMRKLYSFDSTVIFISSHFVKCVECHGTHHILVKRQILLQSTV